MMRVARAPLLLAPLILGVQLLGCASRVLVVQEWILTPSAVETRAPVPGAPPDPVIGVGPVEVPSYLRRPEIVARAADGQVESDPGERWGESLDAGIARVLASDLKKQVPTARLYRHPFPVAARADYVVAVQIERFEPEVDGEVALDAAWSIERTPGSQGPSELPLQRISVREPVAEGGTAARVAAMSRAIGQMSDRIADGLRDLLAAPRPRARNGAAR